MHEPPADRPPAGRDTDTLIVSDVHLGLRTSRPGKLLETLRTWRFKRLILLGDIFHGNGTRRFCAESWELLGHIRALQEARAAEIVWLHGNHDRHLAAAIARLTGIEVRASFAWQQDGRSFLALHGDRFDWFNHRFARLGNLIGRVYAFCLHRLSVEGRWPKRLDAFHVRVGGLHRSVARKALAHARREGIDVIVCGHTHRPGRTQVTCPERGAVTYVNAGCWVDLPASFLTVDASGVRINHAY